MSDFGHGAVGTREQPFTTLLPLRTTDYPVDQLVTLAESMAGEVDTVKDGPDPEENLWVPAGYTYLGQFIDHDLTFDNTSSLNPADAGETDLLPSNLRTPRLDLDSVYGDGPDANPFMYAEDGASLMIKDSFENQSQTEYDQAHQDLLRSPNGRAIIGDKRNDENSIVCQIHLAFVKYHNAVVKALRQNNPELTGTALFNEARDQVRWTYQKLVIEDFLPRIVKAEVFEDLKCAGTPEGRRDLYALYTDGPTEADNKRKNLPREFVVAAYRFGHSGVRTGYRLNGDSRDKLKGTRLSIFPPSVRPTDSTMPPYDPSFQDSLLGFDPLPKNHVIDNWERFFSNKLPSDILSEQGPAPDNDAPDGTLRLQFAYKIDTTMVDPLTVLPHNVLPTSATVGGAIKEVEDTIRPRHLPDPAGRPSLALLNLLRGNRFKVQGGQAIANALKARGHAVEPLDPKYLVVRRPGTKDKHFKFNPIDPSLHADTPLWFYILAEAQKSVVDAVAPVQDANGEFDEKELLKGGGAKTQLGWVGGRIIAEVFYGLLDSDDESYVKSKKIPMGWQPMLGGDKKVIFLNLIKFL
jgi:Animal haem peroxidase